VHGSSLWSCLGGILRAPAPTGKNKK